MLFDWESFLDSRGIPYVHGPTQNVSRDCIGIACPVCDHDDGHHFGISLEDGMPRGCWWSKDHYLGPVRLIAELSGISISDAIALWEKGTLPTDGDIEKLLASLEQHEAADATFTPEPVVWPENSKRLLERGKGSQRKAWDYLSRRGFNPRDLSMHYGARWVGKGHGEWCERVLFPLRWGSTLVGWTGRSFSRSPIRYKSHPPGHVVSRMVFAPVGVSKGGKTLVLMEGPLDAYKVDQLGRDQGVRGAALMGCKLNADKIRHISSISRKYKNKLVMLDLEKYLDALDIASRLSVLGFSAVPCPDGYSDPGDLDIDGMKFFEEYRS